jgi:hypothetical protein
MLNTLPSAEVVATAASRMLANAIPGSRDRNTRLLARALFALASVAAYQQLPSTVTGAWTRAAYGRTGLNVGDPGPVEFRRAAEALKARDGALMAALFSPERKPEALIHQLEVGVEFAREGEREVDGILQSLGLALLVLAENRFLGKSAPVFLGASEGSP